MKGWDPFPLSKCETNCVHITVPYVLLLIIKVSDQFVKYRDRFKMKILIFLLILPAISLAGIPNPIQISCVRCQYRTDFPWLHKLNIGSISSSCGCSAPFPIKVKLAQTGRYCCHNYCPTSPSYTLNSCICGYSTFYLVHSCSMFGSISKFQMLHSRLGQKDFVFGKIKGFTETQIKFQN